MMLNRNPYDEEAFRERFKNSEIFNAVNQDFDTLLWTKHPTVIDDRPSETFVGKDTKTIRQFVAEKYKTFSMVPFYYLEPLLEQSPGAIYDLGCGWNIFKKYIPNVIGISAEDDNGEYFFADKWDFVDDTFVKNHQNYFESVFSICALHFCSLNELPKVLSDFVSMVKPEGRGFISLNSARIIERSNQIDHSTIDMHVRNSLPTDCKFIIIDIDICRNGDGLDGDIRLVFEK